MGCESPRREENRVDLMERPHILDRYCVCIVSARPNILGGSSRKRTLDLNPHKMTEQDVFDLVSDSLGLPRGQIDRESVSADFQNGIRWEHWLYWRHSMRTTFMCSRRTSSSFNRSRGFFEEVHKAESLG